MDVGGDDAIDFDEVIDLRYMVDMFHDPCSALTYESMFNSVQKRFGSNVYSLCKFCSGDEV